MLVVQSDAFIRPDLRLNCAKHVLHTVRHWWVRGASDCLIIEYPVHVLYTVRHWWVRGAFEH